MRFPGWSRASRRLSLVALALVLSAGVVHVASAKEDDRAVAESALKEAEASPRGKEIAKEPIQRAREALERAQRLRDVRDEPRARLCDGLARTWAETARDVVKAAELEARAGAARSLALDAGAQVERERAQLEEGLGQEGRLRAQIEAIEHETKRGPDRTSAIAKDDKKAAIPGDVPESPGPKGGRAKGPEGPKPTPAPKAPAPKAPAAPKQGSSK